MPRDNSPNHFRHQLFGLASYLSFALRTSSFTSVIVCTPCSHFAVIDELEWSARTSSSALSNAACAAAEELAFAADDMTEDMRGLRLHVAAFCLLLFTVKGDTGQGDGMGDVIQLTFSFPAPQAMQYAQPHERQRYARCTASRTMRYHRTQLQ
jgi:hypothetical protein